MEEEQEDEQGHLLEKKKEPRSTNICMNKIGSRGLMVGLFKIIRFMVGPEKNVRFMVGP